MIKMLSVRKVLQPNGMSKKSKQNWLSVRDTNAEKQLVAAGGIAAILGAFIALVWSILRLVRRR